MFGLSGFMMAHLGHAVIVHAACWIPLIIWALEKLRHRLTAKWLLIGVAACFAVFWAGHSPEHGLIFFLRRRLCRGARLARAGRSLALLSGFALDGDHGNRFSCDPDHFPPSAELSSQRVRVGYSFQDFASHALPARQGGATMIFPASALARSHQVRGVATVLHPRR